MTCKAQNLAQEWASIPQASTHMPHSMLGLGAGQSSVPGSGANAPVVGRLLCGLPAASVSQAANLGLGLGHIAPAPGALWVPSP